MDRDTALDRLCREGHYMVSPLYAEIVARAFERTLDRLGLRPQPATVAAEDPLGPGKDAGQVRIKPAHVNDDVVWMYQLAARLALEYGLYANIDHALQSIYHKAESECRYIACRAAIRLARLFGGQSGVDALRERNPHVEERLFHEPPFTGGKEALRGGPEFRI